MTKKLKPCPFNCGYKEKPAIAVSSFSGLCWVVHACGAESTMCSPRSAAIKAWNDRTPDDAGGKEYWLTKQNTGAKMETADVWYRDPRKDPGWKPEWKVIHVKEVGGKKR